MYDIKIFYQEKKKELETLIQTTRIYIYRLGMGFVIEKGTKFILKKEKKKKKTSNSRNRNKESNRTLEKGQLCTLGNIRNWYHQNKWR